MLRDLELTNRGRRIASQPVQLSENEFTFSLTPDSAAPSYVTLQTDLSTNISYPVEIVDPNALIQASMGGVMAVTFRGADGEVSWQPDSSHTLTVWYERGGNDNPELAASTEIGNLYDSYLKLRTAAQCRELMGMDVGKVLATRLAKSDEQWQRFTKKGLQKGVAAKARVFTPPRLRRSYPFIDRTRFFIP